MKLLQSFRNGGTESGSGHVSTGMLHEWSSNEEGLHIGFLSQDLRNETWKPEHGETS